MNIWNNVSEYQPRSSLIAALQDEIKQVYNLETENSELKTALKSHQDVLTIIMKKYRDQSKQLGQLIDFETDYTIPEDDLNSQRCQHFQEKVNQMILVLDNSCGIDEDKIALQQKLINKVHKKNLKIKKMLNVKNS